MEKSELKKHLEQELKQAQNSLHFAVDNYIAAIRLRSEHIQNPAVPPNTPYYSNEDYSKWLNENVQFWDKEVEFWQEGSHKIYTRLSLTIW